MPTVAPREKPTTESQAAASDTPDRMSQGAATRFRRLIPSGGDCTAVEALAEWPSASSRPSGRPLTALNMIASVDGRIAVDGRSAPLGGRGDRELFHALRARADAVMAAAGTVRAERYGPIIRDAAVRAGRIGAGRSAQPLAVIVTRSLELAPDLPLLADRDSHVVILGPSRGAITGAAAQVDYVRTANLRDGLGELAERFGVQTLLCEGGPQLNASLQGDALIDELFVSRSPQLVGGAPDASLIAGVDPAQPLRLELRMLLSQDSHLYAHYAVRGSAE
jgi:riboflavin biosynthesis pyrimidine reductase